VAPFPRIGLAAVAVFALPFVMFYRLMLFHFYIRGAMLSDTGLLGSLMWHNPGFRLPPSLGGESFLAFHVAPILFLVSAISGEVPLTMPQMFAGLVGVSHGLLALAIFWLLVGGFGLRRGLELALAALASAAFAFNGLAIAIARFPHFETFGAACLLLFLVALALGHRLIAILPFLFALATREDFGLHAFGFLALWFAANRLRRRPWRGDGGIIGFALAGLLYSAAALLAQHLAFPGHSSFVRIYLGDPPFADLTAPRLAARLAAWIKLHHTILLPAFATAFWAARKRDPWVLLGYAACLPWLMLHLLATAELAGWMVGYYAFPFLIAMAWPWIEVLPRARTPSAPIVPPIQAATALLLMVALSLSPFGRGWDDEGRMPMPDAFLRAPSAAQQTLTDRAVAAIAAAGPALGQLVVDGSVASLSPFAFARENIARGAEAPPDTVVFFTDGFDAASLSTAPGLTARYIVPGTELHIATNRPAAALRALGIPLVAAE
jgi:hypothetical protein